MKISGSELLEIKNLMESYKKIHRDLSAYEGVLDSMQKELIPKNESQISLIGNRIKESVNFLESERIREKKFYQKLEKKYGPGELDVMTFEYKTSYEKSKK